MMTIVTAWLKEHIFDLVKEFPKYFLPFGIFAAIVLFTPDFTLSKVGMLEIKNQYKPYFGAVLVLSLTFIVSSGLVAIWNWMKKMMNNWLEKRRIISRLRNTTPEEADILREYIEKKTHTLTLGLTDGVVTGLVVDDILWQACDRTYDPGACDFNIHPWIRVYLDSHHELLAHSKPRT